VVNEVADPPLGITKVEEDRTLDAFTPQRSPETLDLAERLRPTR